MRIDKVVLLLYFYFKMLKLIHLNYFKQSDFKI